MRLTQNRKMRSIEHILTLLVLAQMTLADNLPETNRFKIITEEQCQEYLCKYGYLSCSCSLPVTLTRNKRQINPSLFAIPEELRELSTPGSGGASTQPTLPSDQQTTPVTHCTTDHYIKGYEEFQRNYRLNVTKFCDSATKEFMSQSRCGQPDVIETPVTVKRNRRSLSDIVRKSAGLDASITRRKRMLEEYLQEVRTEGSTVTYNGGTSVRSKRSILNITVVNDFQGFWTKSRITWRLMSAHTSQRIPVDRQRAILKQAFRYWSEISPMCFSEQNSAPNVDIEIGFLEGIHLNCFKQFDGYGGEIAHKFYRDVHFDNTEPYTPEVSSDSAISLLLVAVHEIGHVIGLNHTTVADSVMNAIYHRSIRGEFELADHDRKEVQLAYGACNGSFDMAFDYVRTVTLPNGRKKRFFNTYFFRGDHYWMYENNNSRTRYGDPVSIEADWTDLPTYMDAFVQYFEYKSGQDPPVIDSYFFFKGDRYYEYNNDRNRVIDQGLIRNKFPTGPHGSIPTNLDAAFYEMLHKVIYFFQGEYVYKYEYKTEGTHSCCKGPRQRIVDVFVPKTDADLRAPSGATYANNLDTVYFSWSKTRLFFIKGNDVWRVDGYSLQYPFSTNFRVKYIGLWNELWHFICDGECT